MKQIVKKTSNFVLASGFTLAAVASQAQEAPKSPWAYYTELATSLNNSAPEGLKEKKNNLSGYFFSSAAYSASDSWSLGAEHLINLTYLAAGESDFAIGDGYWRFMATNKNVADFGGWKASVLYRWTAPTSAALQQQGGWGVFTVRPSIKNSFGAFSFMARNGVTVPLTTVAYQENHVGKGNPSGIPILSNTFEIFPAYNLVPDTLDFTLYMYLSSKMSSAGQFVKPDTTWGHAFGWEAELAYTLPKNGVLDGVALAYDHESAIFKGADFKIASSAGNYTVKLSKSF